MGASGGRREFLVQGLRVRARRVRQCAACSPKIPILLATQLEARHAASNARDQAPVDRKLKVRIAGGAPTAEGGCRGEEGGLNEKGRRNK